MTDASTTAILRKQAWLAGEPPWLPDAFLTRLTCKEPRSFQAAEPSEMLVVSLGDPDSIGARHPKLLRRR